MNFIYDNKTYTIFCQLKGGKKQIKAITEDNEVVSISKMMKKWRNNNEKVRGNIERGD